MTSVVVEKKSEPEMSFDESLRQSKDLVEIFELVKRAVRTTLGRERAGLMLGLANLGGSPQGFVGAFFPIATNIIVMNSLPLKRVKETDPSLFRPYVFTILLHEYLHTLGIIDEPSTRRQAYDICVELFGKGHAVSQLSADLGKFIPKLVYPVYGWQPQEEYQIELVKGFDRSSTDAYIG